MSEAAAYEALAVSMLFPQERARLSSIGREGKTRLPDTAAMPETTSGAARPHRNHGTRKLENSHLEVQPAAGYARG